MDNKMQNLSMRMTNTVSVPYSGLNMPQALWHIQPLFPPEVSVITDILKIKLLRSAWNWMPHGQIRPKTTSCYII